jgi:aliphatic nitrilase
VYLGTPLTEGEGMVVADLDMALITKRKRMMDSVGHYARPELLSLAINSRPAATTLPLPSSFNSAGEHVNDRQTVPHHREPSADDGTSVTRIAAG